MSSLQPIEIQQIGKGFREIEVEIDRDLMGFKVEITQQLNGISAMRIRPDGMRVYLPEYWRSLNDAWHIIEWAREQGGGGDLIADADSPYVARLSVPGETVEATGATSAQAICNAALRLIAKRQ